MKNVSASLPVVIAAGLTGMAVNSAHAAVSYSVAGSTYSQNFDSLPNTPQNASLGNSPVGWTDDNIAPGAGNFSIPGWYLHHPLPLTEGGFNGQQRMRIGAGTVNVGAFMSFGASGSTERALGDLGSNTLGAVGSSILLGVRFTNNTGATLDRFTITYDGEQWRDGGAATPVAQTMDFMWSTTATAINTGLFTQENALDFTSPVFINTGAGAAVDGNAAGRVNDITGTVTGINWLPGTDLWLRWDDISHAGNDHGLAIDDFNFSAAAAPTTAVPEHSSTLALAGIGIAALLAFRRYLAAGALPGKV